VAVFLWNRWPRGAANSVIASAAKQSRGRKKELDCFVARAPRNDGVNDADPI
jgi:hypothetical protein